MLQYKLVCKLSRIKKGVIDIIAKHKGVSKRTIQMQVEKRRKELGFVYTSRITAFIYASEQQIDLSEYMDEEELKLVKEALGSGLRIIRYNEKKYPIKERKINVIKIQDDELECPNLSNKIINDAKNMSNIYSYLYLFENSIRLFIKDTLEKKYGNEWWNTSVSPSMKNKAEIRIKQEGKNRWHSRRGEHPIFYVDIGDLHAIIIRNQSEFEEVLPENPIEWLTQRMNEIELLRNIIAHHNPIEDDDATQVKLYFKQWIKQISP